MDPGRGRGTRWLWIRYLVGVGREEEHHFLPTPNSTSVASAVDLVTIHTPTVGKQISGVCIFCNINTLLFITNMYFYSFLLCILISTLTLIQFL
jgi:hypothetical protein